MNLFNKIFYFKYGLGNFWIPTPPLQVAGFEIYRTLVKHGGKKSSESS